MFSFFTKSKLNEDLLNKIEETLILSDLGIKATSNIIENLKKQKFNKEITLQELKSFVAKSITNSLSKYEKAIHINKKPFVILVFGTNGSGKTTTISKLGLYFKQQSYSVLFAAGDTFRAGATEQLQVLGNNLNIPVITKTNKVTDTVSVIYKAYLTAKEKNFDILIADTSGRFSNNINLIEELKKVDKTLKKIDSQLPHESILILDGTIGQGSLTIAEGFLKSINITSLIITKIDGSNKGGCLIPITTNLNIPITFLGTGEKSNNLINFNAKSFSKQLIE